MKYSNSIPSKTTVPRDDGEFGADSDSGAQATSRNESATPKMGTFLEFIASPSSSPSGVDGSATKICLGENRGNNHVQFFLDRFVW
jgi:hypothetical protein